MTLCGIQLVTERLKMVRYVVSVLAYSCVCVCVCIWENIYLLNSYLDCVSLYSDLFISIQSTNSNGPLFIVIFLCFIRIWRFPPFWFNFSLFQFSHNPVGHDSSLHTRSRFLEILILLGVSFVELWRSTQSST